MRRIKSFLIVLLLSAIVYIGDTLLEHNRLLPDVKEPLIANDTVVPTAELNTDGRQASAYDRKDGGENSSKLPTTDTIPDTPRMADKAAKESTKVLGQEELKMFHYEKLTQEIKNRITGKSYGEGCDIPYEELRYVKVLYWGFGGEIHNGELIVNQAIAEDIVDIFKELYEKKYPIETMVLVDEYDADDDSSMAADNTSAFNYRTVAGTNRLSKHSYGLAIDINPLYNPYITKLDGKTVVLPENGVEYADRSKTCPYYIRKGDICYEAFIKRGFTWGGDWKNQKDYQHFQKDIDESVPHTKR